MTPLARLIWVHMSTLQALVIIVVAVAAAGCAPTARADTVDRDKALGMATEAVDVLRRMDRAARRLPCVHGSDVEIVARLARVRRLIASMERPIADLQANLKRFPPGHGIPRYALSSKALWKVQEARRHGIDTLARMEQQLWALEAAGRMPLECRP